jgi:NADH-quinone oxidoreductase subunit A
MQSPDFTLTPLTQILMFVIGGALFVVLALFVSRILRPNRPNEQKLASYESGEKPLGTAWIQFNIRFYVLALVFILFEVEIVFLFPWSIVLADKEMNLQTNDGWSWFAFVEMFVFIFVLAIGLAYVWRRGHLDWVKSKPEIINYQSPVPMDLYQQVNKKYQSPVKP